MDESRLVARWARLWSVKDLARVRVEWSARMTRSLGRAYPERRLVRLHPDLRRRPSLRRAVLCHELAHIAAWEKSRGRSRPHGPEWTHLVRAAGFDPALRARVPAASPPGASAPRPRWIHRCPVCQFRRTARRPVPAWRCARCVEDGLPGRLDITRSAA